MKNVLVAFLKQEVFKCVFLILLACFMEIIHVQLPNEGCVIIVSKVNW